MKGINKLILVGHLGGAPVERETRSGRKVCNFSVATNHGKRGPDGEPLKEEETEWHRVSVWGPMAERCRDMLHKGNMVYIEGTVRTREYTGQDGTKNRVGEVTAYTVRKLSKREPELAQVA